MKKLLLSIGLMAATLPTLVGVAQATTSNLITNAKSSYVYEKTGDVMEDLFSNIIYGLGTGNLDTNNLISSFWDDTKDIGSAIFTTKRSNVHYGPKTHVTGVDWQTLSKEVEGFGN